MADVGTGGGSPGIPLAIARPDLEFDLVESASRKVEFLRRWERELPNVRVIHARAEELGRGAGRDHYGVALARGLAAPAVALEWVLPLVRPGGIAVLFAGPSVPDGLAGVAALLGAEAGEPASVSATRQLLVFHKLSPTSERFPRKAGIARKRPLA